MRLINQVYFKMSEHGGKRVGAGRKSVADEDKAQERLLKALKSKYKGKEDEDNVVKFLSEFLGTKEGLKFFAEHIIGKPKEKIIHGGDGITAIVNLGSGKKPDEETTS